MFASLLVVCCQTNKKGCSAEKCGAGCCKRLAKGQAHPSLLGDPDPHQPEAGADRKSTNCLDN